MNFLKKCRFLNGNALKILACVFMVIDHIGFIFFPYDPVWRYIGRISMPLFAFMIAEGCRYTKNRARYFFFMLGCGTAFQIVYYLFTKDTYLNIFITFSLSLLLIFSLQEMKTQLLKDGKNWGMKTVSVLLFLGSLAFVWAVCEMGAQTKFYTVDYGFWGCLLPLFASLLDFYRIPFSDKTGVIKKADILALRVLCFGLGILLFHLNSVKPTLTKYMFLALPFLLLYNGMRGKWKLKYFFYIFYPAHLVLLMGIAVFLPIIKEFFL